MARSCLVQPTLAQILIVEDDADLAQLLGRVFQLGGYRTRWAPDGLIALEALEGELPDVITLDINMPRFSGADVLARLRACTRYKHLPVIVLSSREELPPHVFAQANAVMSKPFDIEALLATTANLLAATPSRERVVGA